jgi:mRNA interferase YafQ
LKLEKVLNLLITGKPLPLEYKEHPLINNFKNHLDCHIEPDWILIFKRDNVSQLITLVRTGTHSDIFKK